MFRQYLGLALNFLFSSRIFYEMFHEPHIIIKFVSFGRSLTSVYPRGFSPLMFLFNSTSHTLIQDHIDLCLTSICSSQNSVALLGFSDCYTLN
jgi:hypothetical protein